MALQHADSCFMRRVRCGDHRQLAMIVVLRSSAMMKRGSTRIRACEADGGGVWTDGQARDMRVARRLAIAAEDRLFGGVLMRRTYSRSAADR
jgi:hypothetical protein